VQTRLVPGAVDTLRRSLEWAGLDYDEGAPRMLVLYAPRVLLMLLLLCRLGSKVLASAAARRLTSRSVEQRKRARAPIGAAG
jgi:hypothetical protein